MEGVSSDGVPFWSDTRWNFPGQNFVWTDDDFHDSLMTSWCISRTEASYLKTSFGYSDGSHHTYVNTPGHHDGVFQSSLIWQRTDQSWPKHHKCVCVCVWEGERDFGFVARSLVGSTAQLQLQLRHPHGGVALLSRSREHLTLHGTLRNMSRFSDLPLFHIPFWSSDPEPEVSACPA